MDRRPEPLRPGRPAATAFRRQAHCQLVSVVQYHDHDRKLASHLGGNGFDSHAGGNELCASVRRWRKTSAVVGSEAEQRSVGLRPPAWQRHRLGRSDIPYADLVSNFEGDGYGFPRAVRIAGCTGHSADAGHRHQLDRHQITARHQHPQASGHERQHLCADADQHGNEFRNRYGWGADAICRRPDKWRLDLGAG